MYSFYLDNVQLPIAPSKLNIKIKNKNKTLNLINDGEINILKKAGLTEVDFDMIIPQVKYPFAIYPNGFKDATYFLNKLELLKQSVLPFQFVVSRVSPGGNLLFDTNLKVSIEEYELKDNVDEGLDITVSVKLKQYGDYGTILSTIKQSTVTNKTVISVEKARVVSKVTLKTYTVVAGDTLFKICKKQLGDGSKYVEIAKLNGIANANLIYPGQVIRFG